MKPTPVAPTSSGVQQMPNQQQEISPVEFEAQLAGYLDKEKPSTIHKGPSDANETNENEIKKEIINEEEPTDETLILDPPLFYTGSFKMKQENQPAKGTVNEQPQLTINQLLPNDEPLFSAQVAVGTEKIVSFIQEEDLALDIQKNQLVEAPMEPLAKEGTELEKSLEQTLVSREETVELAKKPVIKPASITESTIKTQVVPMEKKETAILLEEANLIETNQVQVVTKENELVGTILPTGRFLTAEWKNGRMGVTRSITEPVDLVENSLNEETIQTVQNLQPVGMSETTTDNDSKQLQQPNLDTIENRLRVLTEPNLNEKMFKNNVSFMEDSEITEMVKQITEIDKQGQPIQQSLLVETLSVKQSSLVEANKQANIQMVSEAIIQEVETAISGKQQSVAHVTLSPGKMGEVRITVELTDNVLLTKIVVDNVETRQLLTTGMQRLTDNLDRQNIRLGELTIQLNEQATADSASQERQRKEQKQTFGQKQANFSDNEIETLKSEIKTDTDIGRLSILV